MISKRFAKRTLSLLLVLCMMLGLCPITVFAATEPEYVYVSIGDSMANGYCFDGYYQGPGNGDKLNFREGKGVYGDAAYPNLFADYLRTEVFKTNEENFEHVKLALSATRAEELNYLLGGRDEPTADRWGTDLSQVCYYSQVYEIDKLISYYRNAISKADVISMGIGNASFGAYLLEYITVLMGIGSWSKDEYHKGNLEEALAVLTPEQKSVVMDAYNKMLAIAAPYIDNVEFAGLKLQELIDMLAYITVGFLLNYAQSLDKIVELNPDAEIVLVGFINTTYGIKVTGNGIEVPLGDIISVLFDALNTYTAGLPTVKQAMGEWTDAKFYFAEAPAEPDFIAKQFGALWDYRWEKNVGGLSASTVRNRTIKAFNELKSVFGLTADVTTESISSLGQNWVDGETLNSQISAAVYLAFEEALAQTTDVNEIGLDAVMGIASGDFSAAFDIPNIDLTYLENHTPQKMREDLVNAFLNDPATRSVCKIFSMIKVGDGMSAHPTPECHEVVYRSIVDAYTNDITAQKHFENKMQEYGAKLLAFLKENGADALKQVVGIAEQMYWLSAKDAELIYDQIDMADEAIQSGDPQKMLAYCVQLAEMLFEEYPEEMEALLDTVMDYVEELGAKLYDLVYDYGADALTNLVELLSVNNVINAAQTDLLTQIISVCDEALKSGNAREVRECCGEVAALLYQYAVDEGYVPPVVQAAISLSARIFGRVQKRVQTAAKVMQYITQRRMQTLAAIERIIENFIERRNAYRLCISSAFGMPVWAPWTGVPLWQTPAVEEPFVEEPIVEEPVVQEPEDEIELTVNVETETGRLLLLKWTKYTVQLMAESTVDTLHVDYVQYSTNNRTWKTGTEFTTTEKPNRVYVRVWDDCGGMTSFTYANGTVTKN